MPPLVHGTKLQLRKKDLDSFHAWVGLASEIKYEPIAAARGAFTWSAGDVKEPTHLSKRVEDVVSGVVVYH